MAQLERRDELRRVADPVSPKLEMTAIGDKLLRCGGPAVLFEQPAGYKISCLINLFGTTKRVALGMGAEEPSELRDVGRLLAALKEPEPPRGLKDAGRLLQMVKAVWDMKPAVVRQAPCQQEVIASADIDLASLPGRTRPAPHRDRKAGTTSRPCRNRVAAYRQAHCLDRGRVGLPILAFWRRHRLVRDP